jgi:hypothetical protein
MIQFLVYSMRIEAASSLYNVSKPRGGETGALKTTALRNGALGVTRVKARQQT